MRKLFFTMALIGSFGFFSNVGAEITMEESSLSSANCYQRQYWCSGNIETYTCSNYVTGVSCSQAYPSCFSCSGVELEPSLD